MVASCVFTVLTLSSAADRFWVKGGEDIDGLGGEAGEMQVGKEFFNQDRPAVKLVFVAATIICSRARHCKIVLGSVKYYRDRRESSHT